MVLDMRYYTLTSPISRIPLTKNIENVSKIQICYLNYITASNSNRELKIFINNPDLNVYMWDNGTATNSRTYNLVSVFPLPMVANQQLPFKNVYPWYDIELQHKITTITQLEIVIKIDDTISNDISPSNPLDIGFRFE